MMRNILILSLFISRISFSQNTTITLQPIKDNTIFSESNTESNGAGTLIYVGKTGSNNGGALRRGLIKFNVSSIPSNAIISEAKLLMPTLQAPPTQINNYHNFTLHKITKDWGEGTSTSAAGSGAPATLNDATWAYTFAIPTNFPSSPQWTNLGGDFVSTASATAAALLNEICEWNSVGMISDVNAWIASPTTNFGWMIRGEETVSFSAKGFSSRHYAEILRPQLVITYSFPPVENAFISEVNPQKQWIEIYNPSSPTINLINYRLANGNSIIQFNDIQVLNGSLMLEANKYIVLNWTSIGQNDGELAFYNGNPAEVGTLMKDYIQYGSGNHQRAAAAVSAGVWDNANLFLNTILADTSSYSVNGNNNYASGMATNSVDYLIQRHTPSIKNLICPPSVTLEGNIMSAKYTSAGQLNLIGNLTPTSSVKFISQQSILLQNLTLIPNGAVFEAKIGACSSN